VEKALMTPEVITDSSPPCVVRFLKIGTATDRMCSGRLPRVL